MAEERVAGRPIGEHDWQSREYVDEWIARDVQRDAERRPLLRRMLALAPYPTDAAISVLDVGAGYGVVTEEVLGAFPNARVVLLDHSEPMFEHARRRLGAHAEKIRFVKADLSDAAWRERADGPVELAVSAIAIHNLREHDAMRRVYGAIQELLVPGGAFLDFDLFGVAGGVEAHVEWMRAAGFGRVECEWREDPLAIVAAYRDR